MNIFDKIVNDGEWMNILPGKNILRNFLDRYGKSQFKWTLFRNLIVSEIKNNSIPRDVQRVLNAISTY